MVAKWGSEVKAVSGKIYAALREEGFERFAFVFVGKPDIRRATEEQQNATYKAIEQFCDIKTPDQKKAAALQTRWPSERNKHMFCCYFIENGKPTEVLAAGQIKERELAVSLWIWDEGLRKEVDRQLENMGGEDKLLYRTVDKSGELKDENEMLKVAPGEQGLKDQAAKGKGKDKGGGKNDSKGDKGKGGGKKTGKEERERRW